MKNFLKSVLLVALLLSTSLSTSVLAASPESAGSAKPTQESLNKLFELTQVNNMMGQLQMQMDGMMSNMMQETLRGKTITPEQQKALDVFRAKVMKIQKDEINWETMQPKISEIYQNSLTKDDVDGIIAFYQSPAGQSFVKKMPMVMQQTMTMMQTIMVPMMKKIEAAGQELKIDLQRVDQK